MTWKDHIVECRNTKTGKTASFIYNKYCDSNKIGRADRPSRLPNHYGDKQVWFGDGNWWSHGPNSWFTDRGWDLRPLEMHEDKPYPEAVLAYNPTDDYYEWFILGEYLPGTAVPLADRVYNLRTQSNKDYSWSVKKLWEEKGLDSYCESKGWVFPEGAFEKKEETVETTKEFINRVVDYCTAKSSRNQYLKGMISAGYLNPNDNLDIVKGYVKNYINGSNACQDGKDRAIKALGLVEQKWVEKTMTVHEMLNVYKTEDVRLIHGTPASNLKEWRKEMNAHVPSGLKVTVSVRENG